MPDDIRAGPRRAAGLARAGLLLGAVVLGSPRPASPAVIFPSAALNYYDCQVSIPAGTLVHFYVLALGYPSQQDPPITRLGIAGAEFRIDGLPAEFLVVGVQPIAGGTIEGDLLGAGGRISFPECRLWDPESCLIALLDVTVLTFVPVNDRTIVIRPRAESCNPPFEYTALLRLCDAPTATQLCASTAGMCINVVSYCPYCPLSRPAGPCTLPVAETTWTGMKALYH